MLMNILSVCATVLVLSIYYTDPASDLPSWLNKLVMKKNVKVVPGTITVKEQKNPDMDSGDKAAGHADWENDNRVVLNKWKEAAKSLNRIFFYVFLVMFVVMDVGCCIMWSLG